MPKNFYFTTTVREAQILLDALAKLRRGLHDDQFFSRNGELRTLDEVDKIEEKLTRITEFSA